MAELAIYPIMMPMMSSMTLFRTMVEKKKMIAITAIAPMKAATRIATNPEILTEPAEMLPPSNNMTRATPRPAPLLIPKILGPARGLRKAVCSISPLTASALPQSIAVIACGRRDSSTIYRQEALLVSSPRRILNTSPAGILIDPITRFRIKSTITSAPNPRQYLRPLCMIIF